MSVAAPPLAAAHDPTAVHELPALETLFDPGAIAQRLQDGLLGGPRARFEIEGCRPGHAFYVPGDRCLLQYELELRDRASGAPSTALVNARAFPGARACQRYFRERLAPLVERARGRADLRAFAEPAAVLDELIATVCAFPLDGELPTLVDATDPRGIAAILRRALSAGGGRPSPERRWRSELVQYGRRRRHCVLRYAAVEGEGPGVQVYGKVAADDRGAVADAALRRLAPLGFRIPASLGFHPHLRLLLLEAMPGAAVVRRLLRARLRGEGPGEIDLTLASALESCARIAAGIHASGIGIGPRRDARVELSRLRADIGTLHPLWPQLGSRLSALLAGVEDRLLGSPPLPASLCHGDFRHSQVLFEGAQATVVDFDTLCQAEPALDLGHFLAYLKLAAYKERPADGGGADPGADELREWFLDRYLLASGGLGEARIRRRVAAYETLSLLRLAVHAWQKFKPHRHEMALTLLEGTR